jgi:hypothetical protein
MSAEKQENRGIAYGEWQRMAKTAAFSLFSFAG